RRQGAVPPALRRRAAGRRTRAVHAGAGLRAPQGLPAGRRRSGGLAGDHRLRRAARRGEERVPRRVDSPKRHGASVPPQPTVNSFWLRVFPADAAIVIGPVVAPAGTFARTEVGDSTVNGVSTPLKRTTVVPVPMPGPEIVTGVPTGPLVGV